MLFRSIDLVSDVDNNFAVINIGHQVYGMGLDQHNHLFIAGWTSVKLSRLNVLSGEKEWTVNGVSESRGVAVTEDGDVWTANSGPGTVTRWSNDGLIRTHIPVGSTPTGVSVDAAGKVWVVNYGDEYIHRINPATDSIDLSKRLVNTRHYGYSDMTGIIARNATVRHGLWAVIHDGQIPHTVWGLVKWNGSVPEGASMSVRVRSSADRLNWSPWESAVNGAVLAATPPGRFLEIEATLQAGASEATPVLYDVSVAASAPGEPDLAVGLAAKRVAINDRIFYVTYCQQWAMASKLRLEYFGVGLSPVTSKPATLGGGFLIGVEGWRTSLERSAAWPCPA